jgi:3'-phosphoadenosine 5'-phosphosulfate sulfotransferase (PAPS reductase)/FAD synthetase
MMLKLILDSHDGQLPQDVSVLFSNTGKEMPETLDFVSECSQRWGVPIVWLEYFDHDDPQKRWRQVSYQTASRNGEPLADLIGRKKLLPNPVTRFCTVEAKIRVMKLYAQQVLGFHHWDVAIGFRADEPARVAKLSIPNKEPFDRFAPLASAGLSVRDVSSFWKGQAFDLRLPSVDGKTIHGNCDLCFLKGASQVLSLIREVPDRADWWAFQETRVVSLGGRGHVFRFDRPDYAHMQLYARQQADLFGFNDVDGELVDCGCTD